MKAFWKYNVYATLRYEVDLPEGEAVEMLKRNIKWPSEVHTDRIMIRRGIGALARKHIDVFIKPVTETRTEFSFNIHDLMPAVNYALLPITALGLGYLLFSNDELKDAAVVVLLLVAVAVLAGLWLIIFIEERMSTYFAKGFVKKVIESMDAERVKRNQ